MWILYLEQITKTDRLRLSRSQQKGKVRATLRRHSSTVLRTLKGDTKIRDFHLLRSSLELLQFACGWKENFRISVTNTLYFDINLSKSSHYA